jgi:hypothetical protein
MDFVGFPKVPRLSREVVVTEKIDGTNASVLIERNLEHAIDSPPWAKPVETFDGTLWVSAASRSLLL